MLVGGRVGECAHRTSPPCVKQQKARGSRDKPLQLRAVRGDYEEHLAERPLPQRQVSGRGCQPRGTYRCVSSACTGCPASYARASRTRQRLGVVACCSRGGGGRLRVFGKPAFSGACHGGSSTSRSQCRSANLDGEVQGACAPQLEQGSGDTEGFTR